MLLVVAIFKQRRPTVSPIRILGTFLKTSIEFAWLKIRQNPKLNAQDIHKLKSRIQYGKGQIKNKANKVNKVAFIHDVKDEDI